MADELIVTGVIIKDSPVGEYDKRVSLLTLERGRISAFLKGAKRPGKSALSHLGPFFFGKFALFEGRNSYTVKRAEHINRFEGIKNDLSNLAYGSYFLDVAGFYSRENTDETDRVKLIYQSLRALENDSFTKEFVRLIYELKNIAIMGEFPNVFECSLCRKREDLVSFLMERRGMVCSDCRKKASGGMEVGGAVLKALMHIFLSTPEKLYTFKLSDEAQGQLREFADRYIKRYFHHEFKTLEFLDLLT